MEHNNPFGAGILSVLRQLQAQKWEPPFLTNVVTSFALIVAICILSLLYPTIGLFTQLTATFLRLIRETFVEMKPKPPVEKVGHAVAIGVYATCVLVFGVFTLPFYLIGYLLEWLPER